ncbi:MAG: dihydrofolate reductase [Bacteroidia bacterium]|nr:dihydrofolate reductase [Bacteroidia bacterium]
MKISLIVALSENNVVGDGNRLPWKLSADLKRVKALTMGHHIIMGRKTFESIGKPLPGRTNVVISRNPEYRQEGCTVVTSLQEAFKLSRNDSEVFVFGGGEIFRQAIPWVTRICMTRVHHTIQGDTTFPDLDMNEWKIVQEESYKADEKNEYDYSFIILERTTGGRNFNEDKEG